jgi:hypothetical protein
MSEIPVALFNAMRSTFERYGIRTSDHLHGLSLAGVSPSAFGGRVSWDELALFSNRAADGLTHAQQEAVGELYPLENRWIHFLLRTALTPRRMHRILWASTPYAFPHIDVGVDEHSDAHVVVRMTMPRRYRGCEVFFRATTGECRTITELFGIGRSAVDADVSGWHGVYRVRFPAVLTAREELSATSARLLGDRRWKLPALIGWLFGFEHRDLRALEERLQAQGLSPEEAHVVVRLGQGAPLRQIAAELGWSAALAESRLASRHGAITAAVRHELAARVLDA